ncbi:MAG TPA: hypothetical protein VIL86_12360 [Tepidisphaeraceae bacterium]
MLQPTLSVVVAAWQDADGLEECLAALHGQQDEGVETIVVATGNCARDAVARFPWVQLVKAGDALLTPQLWSIGMARAKCEWVAITTAHFAPAADWVRTIRQTAARAENVAGIGGAIDPPRTSNLVDWATYFQRYNAYLHLRQEQTVNDIAGDNAAYRRGDLLRQARFLRDGFWEPDFHRLVLAEGKKLLFTPAMRVTMIRSFGFWRFIGQRFHHGIQFGQARMRGKPAGKKAIGVLLSPLIPAVFFVKIARRVIGSGRNIGMFFACLPILSCFLKVWALGEVIGYVTWERTAEPVTQ